MPLQKSALGKQKNAPGTPEDKGRKAVVGFDPVSDRGIEMSLEERVAGHKKGMLCIKSVGRLCLMKACHEKISGSEVGRENMS